MQIVVRRRGTDVIVQTIPCTMYNAMIVEGGIKRKLNEKLYYTELQIDPQITEPATKEMQ